VKLDFIYFLIVFIAFWGEEFSLERESGKLPFTPFRINCLKKENKIQKEVALNPTLEIDADFAGKSQLNFPFFL
jgi:hypothetical protein